MSIKVLEEVAMEIHLKISSFCNHDHSAILSTREGLEYTIHKIRKKRHGVSQSIRVREAAQTVSEDWLTEQVDKSKLETCLVGYLTAKGTKGGSDSDAYFIGNKSLKSNWYVLVSTVSLEWIQQMQALGLQRHSWDFYEAKIFHSWNVNIGLFTLLFINIHWLPKLICLV